MDKLDILNRDKFVDDLISLTETISKNHTTTSFAINGSWGCGKTFVLDMYEKRLSAIQSEDAATDKYFVIRYNCWKYDYYEEPLVAIVADVLDNINQKQSIIGEEEKARLQGILKFAIKSLRSIINAFIKDKVGIDILKISDDISDCIESEEGKALQAHDYDEFYSFNTALKSLQTIINQLSETYTVVLLVDELDRCLPTYSVKVLERLHHLTEGTNNVITVLSIDKHQLGKSITQVFGFDNPSKYLEKFISFELPLDCGTVSPTITEKYPVYFSMFDRNLIPLQDSVEEFIQAVFDGIDARKQEDIIKRATIAHQLLFKDKKDYIFMCMELMISVLICFYGNDMCLYDSRITFISPRDSQINGTFSQFFGTDKNYPRPRFASFIEQKFENTDYHIHGSVPNVTIELRYKDSHFLYTSILYIWSQICSSESGVYFGTILDPYKIVDHHTDLKEFAKIIMRLK